MREKGKGCCIVGALWKSYITSKLTVREPNWASRSAQQGTGGCQTYKTKINICLFMVVVCEVPV